MYKVFIVDDESIIVEGLKRVVDWKKYNCEVCGTATNGKDGLKAIQELRPDILFSDIRMPELDGLQMIASLKSEFPKLQITILTGFHDFTYAQQAIKMGVTRLLTKPSKMDELIEAVEFMTNILNDMNSNEDIKEEIEKAEEEKSSVTGSFIVSQAIKFMEQSYQTKITLQDVAEHCYVSQWHLSKLLNKYSEKNFYEILNNIRIKKATELLHDPKLRISDISEMVGYSDSGHFCRIFKKSEGVSANEYRNSLGELNN